MPAARIRANDQRPLRNKMDLNGRDAQAQDEAGLTTRPMLIRIDAALEVRKVVTDNQVAIEA